MTENQTQFKKIPIPAEFKKFVDATIDFYSDTPHSIRFVFCELGYGIKIKIIMRTFGVWEEMIYDYIIPHDEQNNSLIYPDSYIALLLSKIQEMQNELQMRKKRAYENRFNKRFIQ